MSLSHQYVPKSEQDKKEGCFIWFLIIGFVILITALTVSTIKLLNEG